VFAYGFVLLERAFKLATIVVNWGLVEHEFDCVGGDSFAVLIC